MVSTADLVRAVLEAGCLAPTSRSQLLELIEAHAAAEPRRPGQRSATREARQAVVDEALAELCSHATGATVLRLWELYLAGRPVPTWATEPLARIRAARLPVPATVSGLSRAVARARQLPQPPPSAGVETGSITATGTEPCTTTRTTRRALPSS